MTEHSKSSPTLTPTWTTWWPTTTRRLPAWRTFPPLTWGKAHIQGSTSSNTTSPRAPAHSAGWATNGGKPCTAAWSARLGARNTSGCMWYPVLISGIKPWGEKGLFFSQVIQVRLFITPADSLNTPCLQLQPSDPVKDVNINLVLSVPLWCVIFSFPLAPAHFCTCAVCVL